MDSSDGTQPDAGAVALEDAPVRIERPVAARSPLPRFRVQYWHVGAWVAVFGVALLAALAETRVGWLTSWTGGAPPMASSALVLLLLAMGCEFIKATIGMGYGMTLTPILLILGYPIGMVVPGVLLSQFLADLSAAFFHHKAGNFNFWQDHHTRNTALLMGGVGLVVSVATVLLALSIPPGFLRPAVTVMVLGMGVFMLVAPRARIRFRMRNVGILAGLAAFNKAFSGGGYGALACGGQVLSGLPVRAAVASTIMAEAVVCVAAVVSYYASGRTVPLHLLLPLIAGAMLSTPVSAVSLNRMPQAAVKRVMALVIVGLAAYALWVGKGI